MFNNIPHVVKNLLIINVLFFVAMYAVEYQFDFSMTRHLGLYYPGSQNFQPYQFVTYMFMHGGIAHIFFNMYALFIFGASIENAWGGKRFFIYYMVCGIGAGLIQVLVIGIRIYFLSKDIPLFQLNEVYENGARILREGKNYTSASLGELNILLNTATVGASGAVFGILLAFGMMYPDARLMLLIPPIPIKAKWLVIGYGALELFLGFSQPGSNIAHFAHLGGMLFGFLLIRYWIAQARRRD
jgi:membrane associated rhomboid family serine protease